MQNPYILYKNEGETPLQALERLRGEHPMFAGEKMTYAGRLDPMAEGVLLVLWGDKVHEKEAYINLSKIYEIEVLLGFSTDTHDILGLVQGRSSFFQGRSSGRPSFFGDFIGKFDQEYPDFSSRTVLGKPLWQYAREGDNLVEKPTKSVEIYSISDVATKKLAKKELESLVFQRISKVSGDFRQSDILKSWEIALKESDIEEFELISLSVACSSGTYMRSLAHEIGRKLGIPALAWRIKRVKVGSYELN